MYGRKNSPIEQLESTNRIKKSRREIVREISAAA